MPNLELMDNNVIIKYTKKLYYLDTDTEFYLFIILALYPHR